MLRPGLEAEEKGGIELLLRCALQNWVWRPRFLITVINANDRISRVKPVKHQSNLGQPGSSLENLANEP
jgi:hypothetical protein